MELDASGVDLRRSALVCAGALLELERDWGSEFDWGDHEDDLEEGAALHLRKRADVLDLTLAEVVAHAIEGWAAPRANRCDQNRAASEIGSSSSSTDGQEYHDADDGSSETSFASALTCLPSSGTGRRRRARRTPKAAPAWEAALERASAATAEVEAARLALGGMDGGGTAVASKGAEGDVRTRSSGSTRAADFAKFRCEFKSAHVPKVRSQLAASLGGKFNIVETPLAENVKRNFSKALQSATAAAVVPAFHGTDVKNHASIFQHGLLIPGRRQGVSIRHGHCHGAGIYTSNADNAWLALGFCTAPRILLCAVLDDAVSVPPRQIGSFRVTRESSAVRHIGAAIVVFEPARIVPLFEVVGTELHTDGPAGHSRPCSPHPFAVQASGGTAAGGRKLRKKKTAAAATPPPKGSLAAYYARRAKARRRG